MLGLRRFIRLPLAGLLLLALAACAQPGPSPALWRISDADSEIWLFGTVHVLPRGLHWRSAEVNAAFAGADTIVFETDLDAGGGAAFQDLVATHGRLVAGGSLRALLPDDNQAQFDRITRDLNIDPRPLDSARPWLAALQLSLVFAQRAGGDPAAGVENVLGAEARGAGKEIAFLESPEAQIRALADLSPEAELAFLISTMRQIEEDSGENDALDRAWLSGDTETLARLLDALLREAGPEAHAAIITTRNASWAEQIAVMLNGEGEVFIAVGAAHLVGDDSVVAMLRARGIAVEGP